MPPLTEPQQSTIPFPKLPPKSDTRGIHVSQSRANSMPELKDDLASLRIDRDSPDGDAGGLPLSCFCLPLSLLGPCTSCACAERCRRSVRWRYRQSRPASKAMLTPALELPSLPLPDTW